MGCKWSGYPSRVSPTPGHTNMVIWTTPPPSWVNRKVCTCSSQAAVGSMFPERRETQAFSHPRPSPCAGQDNVFFLVNSKAAPAPSLPFLPISSLTWAVSPHRPRFVPSQGQQQSDA